MSKGVTMAASGGGGDGGPVRSSSRQSAVVTGTGWTKVVDHPSTGRAGLWVWNSSNAFQTACLWLPVGSPTPAGADLTHGNLVLATRQSVFLDLGDGFDFFSMHDAGPALVATVVTTEVSRS